jgi:hypothetical protein
VEDDGPPAQAGDSIEGRPRTTGGFQFKTRPTPAEHDGAGAAQATAPPQLPTRQPLKPISVRAAKDFFESKASQTRSAPPARPSAPARPSGAAATTEISAAKKTQRNEQAFLSSDVDPSHPRKPAASIVRQDSPVPENMLLAADTSPDDSEPTERRTSTTVLNAATGDGKPLGFERRAFEDSSKLDEASNAPLIALEKARRSRQRQDSEDTVRRRTTRRSTSTAEMEEATASGAQNRSQGRHSGSGYDVRGSVEEDTRPIAHRIRRRTSRSAPIEPSDDAFPQPTKRDSMKKSASARDRKSTRYRDNVDDPIAAQGLSHDGSSSDPHISRRTTASGHIPTANVGVQSDYFDIEVPDHVDRRGAYGRRKTQDFGFPGARIKPRKTFRTYKPLEDPGDWIKRSCGHFSQMGKYEVRADPAQRPCRQCLAKAPQSDFRTLSRRYSRKRAATDTSISSSSLSSAPIIRRRSSSGHRRHHSECMPADKCGDTFARDLGHIIDAIIDEHTTSLQSVINNIKQTQPSLAQLRRVSEDLAQRCQQGGKCTVSKHSTCQPSCMHQVAYQPICRPICQPVYQPVFQPVCQPQTCQWQPSCPCVPPKPAEKLNVGSPGQLKPNVNDSPSTLREVVQTVPDLVDLVNSAADNLGVDLDRRPTARDDQAFQEAPIQNPSPDSASTDQSEPQQSVRDQPADDEHTSEDPWLQQTRRHLSELSEARTQMMDELDTIAEDLGIQLQDRRTSEPPTDPIQRALSKVSTGLSRQSTRLRNKSIDSVVEEIPKIIDQKSDERRLSRVLTRVMTESRRMSAANEDGQELGEFSPRKIQQWLATAQVELPAAINSITNVLDVLPALDEQEVSESSFSEESLEYVPIYEPQPRYLPFYEEPIYEPVYDEEPEYELIYESEPDVEYEYEPELEPEYEEQDEAGTPLQRSYTEPLVELNDRIAELERRLRQESMRAESREQSEDESAITEENDESVLERVTTRRATIPPSRKPTNRSPEVETEHSFSSDL